MQRFLSTAVVALCLPLAACNETSSLEGVQDVEATTVFKLRDEASLVRAEKLALAHVQEVQPELIAGAGRVSARRVIIDTLGQAHTRLTQSVDGIPVFGTQAIVHLNKDGSFRSMTDRLAHKLEVNTAPSLTRAQAVALAVAHAGGWTRVTGEPAADLQILRQEKDHLTYQVRIDQFQDSENPAIPVVFVDAHDGKVLMSYDDLQTARDRKTYTANNGTSLPGTLVRNETSSPSGDAVLDSLHDYNGLTYDYYATVHGRDSFNKSGATLTSTLHYSSNYVNAYWNGSQTVFGDGDNVTSGPLSTLDVSAHEWTHAVTDYDSDLIYSNESGALNEAMSDIMAAAVEAWANPNATFQDIWYVGEDCWLSEPALRYMNDPAQGGDYDYYPTRYTGSSDNGGVHWNSGIANLAFHLLSVGGTHPRGKTSTVVTGVGIQDAAAIFYRANSVYLTPSSTFADARAQTVQAAEDLFGAGSQQATSVGQAWDAVGVAPPPAYSLIDTRSNLSDASGGTSNTFNYPTNGATAMKFVTSGGTGDADIYVRFGAAPTTTSYDCRPYSAGNNETCEFNPAQSGTYYVMIHAYSSYSGVTLDVYSNGAAVDPEVCSDGVDNDGDGSVDCADSDCAADPVCQTACFPVGAACSVNSDCCTNKCRGASGAQTCK